MKKISMFNLLKKQSFMKRLMKRRKNNKGIMWLSLFTIGISSLLMGMRREQNNDAGQQPLQNMIKNFTSKRGMPLMNDAALTEFSEELLASALRKKEREQRS